MEIESIAKHISLEPIDGGTVVSYAGQVCLRIRHTPVGMYWIINPPFAKMTAGVNCISGVPMCTELFPAEHEAIAAGLTKLHDLGSFRMEVDLPEDSTASELTTTRGIVEDCRQAMHSHGMDIMKVISAANLLHEALIACVPYTGTDPVVAKIMEGRYVAPVALVEELALEVAEEPTKVVTDPMRIWEETRPEQKKFVVYYTDKAGKLRREVRSSFSPRGIVRQWPERAKEFGHVLKDIKHAGSSVMADAVKEAP